MEVRVCKRSMITREPAMLSFIPEVEEDQRTLEEILATYPSLVSGFGRDPFKKVILHLQIALPEKEEESE